MFMNSELTNSEIWLKSALQEDPEKEEVCLRQPVEKCYCLSVAKVSYGRDEALLTGKSAIYNEPLKIENSTFRCNNNNVYCCM